MARIKLRHILAPGNEVHRLLDSFVKAVQTSVYIEDNTGQILFGNPTATIMREEAVRDEEGIIGWVKGDESSAPVSAFIQLLVQKEAEKKKLGQEVLLLYQDVNLMFDFSERLAQTIGQNPIAAITLDEAARLIQCEQALIILWDEDNQAMQILASSGKPLFDQRKLQSNAALLRTISQSGLSDIMSDLTPLKEAGLIPEEVKSLIYAALKVKQRVLGAIILASTEAISYKAADLKFLVTLALQSSSAIESALLYEKNIREAKEREEAMRRVYEVTNKFVPHEFIRSLGRSVITDIQLGDKVEKIVTVLFSDIREFTTLSEKMTPDENFNFVSSFNERMGPIIRKHQGFINQYLGDAIMAIFPRQASDALAAAIEMQAAVQELNAIRMANGQLPIKIGVGMHTGPLIMGITGDHERLDAATISDTVNTASRLEGLTKYYKTNILLSEASVKNLADPESFHYRQLGLIQLKGKRAPVFIYECFDGNSEQELNKKLSALPFYRQGLNEYFSKSFQEASATLSRVLEIHPEDGTAQLFLNKAMQYIQQGIPDNWTGVEEMAHK